MSLWRYIAVDLAAPQSQRSGELAGASAADVRASLRRAGLQVIEIRPVRPATVRLARFDILRPHLQAMQNHRRRRRGPLRTELYDSLATLLSAGVPLLEAIQTLVDSQQRGKRSGMRSMLIDLRERLRSGDPLGEAMQAHGASWFDAVDIAIVRAGEHAGNLSQVLSSMALRQHRADELGHKLIGALAYPLLVMLVGLGVVVFLSVRTLPQLAKILTDAKIAVPALTQKIMWTGQLLAHHWLALVLVVATLVAASSVARDLLRRRNANLPFSTRRLPGGGVFRTLAVGGLALRLAELLRSGVPMTEALRVLAPTCSNSDLSRALTDAVARIERGEDLAQALHDERWFDAEFSRLLDVGQSTGELDAMLQRIGERYQRQAQRTVDRLTAMLEPFMILCLAVLVGTVVMAAILPLIRLQEIL